MCRCVQTLKQHGEVLVISDSCGDARGGGRGRRRREREVEAKSILRCMDVTIHLQGQEREGGRGHALRKNAIDTQFHLQFIPYKTHTIYNTIHTQ